MSAFLSVADFERIAGAGTAAALTARQVPVGRFEWLTSVRRLRKRGGEELADVFCGVADGQLFAFPPNGGIRRLAMQHLGLGDWEFKQVPLTWTQPSVEHRGEQIILALTFLPTSPLERLEVVLDEKTLAGATGPWLSAWGAATAAAAGCALPPLPFGVMNWRRWTLAENSFGLVPAPASGLTLCGVVQEQWVVYPFRPVPSLEGQSWTMMGEANAPGTSSLWVLANNPAGLPEVVQWQEYLVGGQSPLLNGVRQWLDGVPRTEFMEAWQLKNRGVYPLSRHPMDPPRPTVLRREGAGFLVAEISGDAGELRFEEAFACEGQTVLVDAEGRCGQVRLPRAIGQALAKELRLPDRLRDGTAPGETWTVGLVRAGRQATSAPRKIALNAYEVRLGEERLPLGDGHKLEVEAISDGCGRLRIWPGAAGSGRAPQTDAPSWEITVPEKVAFALTEAWEVAQAEFHGATASVAGLYKEFNDAKKYNLLCVLFADVVALNRQLNEGVSMTDLIVRLGSNGSAEFSSDKELRKQTLTKVMALSVALPEIKRNFEHWAALYPYHWVQQDVDWIGSVFGEEVGRQLLPGQRRRKVPLIRHAVRTAQAGMQRALGEIEAAIRPLEQTMAREEVQSFWAHKARQILPLLAPGLNGTAVVASASVIGATLGGAVIPTAVVMTLVAMAAKWASENQSKREDDALFQRVAKNVLPWWQVFMRTLSVSIHETGQFIDEENIRAMTLDKELLGRFPAAHQPEMRQRLTGKLRERIVAEKHREFTELLEGSGIRVRHLVNDLRRSTGEEGVQLGAFMLPPINPPLANAPAVTPPPTPPQPSPPPLP